MGLLSKAWKGITKPFKSIAKRVKKAFKSFGKFMGKMGIAGQIAMMFILPGIGGALMKGFGAMAGNMAGLTGSFAGLSGTALGGFVKGVGTVLKGAYAFVQTGVNAFKTVTRGISEFVKTGLNKIPGINISSAKANFFGKGGVFDGIQMDASKIFDPFKSSLSVTSGTTLEGLAGTTGLSEQTLQQLNPNVDFTALQEGSSINLDFGNIVPKAEQINGLATSASGLPNIVPDSIQARPIESGGFSPVAEPISISETSLNFSPNPEFELASPFPESISQRVTPLPTTTETLPEFGPVKPELGGYQGLPETGITPDKKLSDYVGFDVASEKISTALNEDPIGTVTSGIAALNQALNPPEEEYFPSSPGIVVEYPTYQAGTGQMGAAPLDQQPVGNLLAGSFGLNSYMADILGVFNMPFGSEKYFQTLRKYG